MNILKKKEEVKFCPICGKPAKMIDAYCMKCGHQFRQVKSKKPQIKRIIIALIIVVLAYFTLRYFAGQPIIPTSLQDAINITLNLAPKKDT